MEPLITVVIMLAIATFGTGLLLPLTAPRREGQGLTDEEQLSAEVVRRG